MEGKIISEQRKSGYTIVEIMVVMAIMAMLSALGIAALVGINNNALADKAAESVLNQLREAQNKAISVASEPNVSPDSYPLAWGVKIVPGTVANPVTKYYIKNSASYNYVPLEQESDQVAFTIDSVSKLSGGTMNVGAYLNYSTPFSAFTLQEVSGKTDPCHSTSSSLICGIAEDRPYSIQFDSSENDGVEIKLKFRNVVKTIRVGANGEAYISD